jgi:hypothetical protein
MSAGTIAALQTFPAMHAMATVRLGLTKALVDAGHLRNGEIW